MAYALTFAGQSFALETAALALWRSGMMPMEATDIFLPPLNPWGGKNLHGLLNDTLPPYPNLRIGDFFYPTGARRWSVFHGIAVKSQVVNMMNLALPSGQNPVAQPFLLQSDIKGNPALEGLAWNFTTPMYMLTPRVLANHYNSKGGEPLYLVTLVDERYWWHQNASVQEIFTGSLMTPKTWANLLTDIANALNITIGTPNPINTVYGNPEPDSDLFSNYEDITVLLDAVCANIGCVFVRDLDGMTYHALPNTGDPNGLDSDTRIATNRNKFTPMVRLAGGNMFDILSGAAGPDDSASTGGEQFILPAQVSVTFPKFNVPGGMGSTTGSWMGSRPTTTWIEDSYNDVWVETITLAEAGFGTETATANTGRVLRDTAKAIYYGTPGSGASATATIANGAVTGFAGIVGGSNYTVAPRVVLTGGGGSGATATAQVMGGQVTGLTVTNGGQNYTSPPTVVFQTEPDNETTLNQLATQMATDYYDWLLEGLDETYPGIVPWTPEGVHDILWSYRLDKASTRVIPKAWNYAPVEFQHSVLAVTETSTTSSILASIVNGGSQSVSPGGNGTPLTWANGYGPFWSAGSPTRLTVPNSQPSGGVYTMYGEMQFLGVGINYHIGAAWTVNGAYAVPVDTNGLCDGLNQLKWYDGYAVHLNPGDYVELAVWHDAPSALTVIPLQAWIQYMGAF